MKIPNKHYCLMALVIIALAIIFLPMIWEKDLYPKHLLLKRHAEKPPSPLVTKMPAFDKDIKPQKNIEDPHAWTIQVSSLKDKDKAIKLRDQLRSKNYSAFLEASSKGDEAIRILVGPYPNADQAKADSEKINQQYQFDSIVTEYKTGNIKEIKP